MERAPYFPSAPLPTTLPQEPPLFQVEYQLFEEDLQVVHRISMRRTGWILLIGMGVLLLFSIPAIAAVLWGEAQWMILRPFAVSVVFLLLYTLVMFIIVTWLVPHLSWRRLTVGGRQPWGRSLFYPTAYLDIMLGQTYDFSYNAIRKIVVYKEWIILYPNRALGLIVPRRAFFPEVWQQEFLPFIRQTAAAYRIPLKEIH